MDFALIFWLGRKLGWIQQTAPKPTRKQTIIGGLALLIVLVAVGLWCGKYANRCLTYTKGSLKTYSRFQAAFYCHRFTTDAVSSRSPAVF